MPLTKNPLKKIRTSVEASKVPIDNKLQLLGTMFTDSDLIVKNQNFKQETANNIKKICNMSEKELFVQHFTNDYLHAMIKEAKAELPCPKCKNNGTLTISGKAGKFKLKCGGNITNPLGCNALFPYEVLLPYFPHTRGD